MSFAVINKGHDDSELMESVVKTHSHIGQRARLTKLMLFRL